jgi:alkylhydroperoxidase family enzyme
VPFIDIPDGDADPEVRVWALRPEIGMGAGALSHAIYEQSIVNGCAICQQWRKTPGADGRLSEADYAHVCAPDEYDGYSPRERLAIAYAEKFALDHHAIDADFFARLRDHFSDAEILDLTVCIGGWLALGRTLHVLGIDEYCRLG